MTLPFSRTWFAVVALVLAGAGCYRGSAHAVSLADVGREPGWMIVSDVHVVRQTAEHDCGPAALTIVLEHWGVAGARAELGDVVTEAPEQGVKAGALRDFARKKGLKAFLISGEEADLVREVRSNRPVLVGLIQRYSGNRATSHYEVVIGINPGSRRVLLLDPGHGTRQDDLASFGREWEGAGRLALVIGPT